jgi:hypothetical protein
MGPWMSQIHSAFTNLRNIPGLWPRLAKYWQETTRFIDDVGPKINEAFKAAGPLSKEQRYRVAAYMQGWNKSENSLKKMIPELGRSLGKSPLAPGLQGKMTQQELKLATDLRKILDGTWKKFEPSLDNIRNELGAKGVKIGNFLEDYFPRFTAYSRYEKAGLKAAASGPKGYQPMIDQLVESKIASGLHARRGLSLTNINELKRMAEIGDLDGRVVPAIESFVNNRVAGTSEALRQAVRNIKEAGTLNAAQAQTKFVAELEPHLRKLGINLHARLGSQKAAKGTLHFMAESLLGTADDAARFGAEVDAASRALSLPAEYSMDVVKVMPRYISSLAPTYAWWAKGHGPAITKIINKPGIFANNRWQEEFTRGQLLPLMRGMKDWRSFSRATHFGDWKHRQMMWLKTSDVAKRFIPEKTREWMTKYFSDVRGSLSAESFGSNISRYFYLSTLGFNIAPATKNMLQNYITLMNMPGIGPRGIWMGLNGTKGSEGLIHRLGTFQRHLSKGASFAEAFKRAFPDFVREVGSESGVLNALMSGDMYAEGRAIPKLAGTLAGKAQKAALLPFSMSELGNRLLGFYAAKNSHMAAGFGSKAAREFGLNATMASHFFGGPLAMPRALMGMPQPFRQFLQFPLRFAGFLHSSPRWGPDPTKLDFGTIGRVLLGSTAAYTVGKNLAGVDLAPGLLWGALPLPTYEQAPFHPFPFVPPAVSVAGSAVKALTSGEAKPLMSALTLLTPGGVAARRAYKSLSPKFADYNTPTPDGRIPLYNENHALVGTYSPMQLFMRSVGVTPSSVAGEQGAAKWLLSQRDKIRQLRREYLEAATKNNWHEAEKINQQFQKDYPGLGPLQIKKSDLNAIHNRREISRLNRILKGFPAAYRPMFAGMVAETSLAKITEDLQQQPLNIDWLYQQ